MKGKTHEPIQEAVPGDIIAVAKVEGLHIGDTVAFRTDAPMMPGVVLPGADVRHGR